MTTVIHRHDNLDVDVYEDGISISQTRSHDGVTESVWFHRRHLRDVIRALKEIEGPSIEETMRVFDRRHRAIVQNIPGDA